MRKFALSIIGAVSALAMMSTPGHTAECGEVTITEMNWASSQIVTAVSKFLMEQGYGCKVKKVPSATTTAVASLAENGEPDIVTELWVNSAGEAYDKLKKQGKVVALAKVIEPGGVEGWWVPEYLAKEHPELKTIKGVMAHPDWVGKRFNNCPDGWGCRIVNDNLIKALDLEKSGIKVFNHGSGETLATSIAAAYTDKKPWFGYYWGPTAVLGKYKMTKVELGPIDEKIHEANQNKDNPNPGVSDFPPAPVMTVVTSDFKNKNPEIADLMSKVSFDINLLNELLAWQEANKATPDQAAVQFLTKHSDVWSKWINDSAREKLAKLLKK